MVQSSKRCLPPLDLVIPQNLCIQKAYSYSSLNLFCFPCESSEVMGLNNAPITCRRKMKFPGEYSSFFQAQVYLKFLKMTTSVRYLLFLNRTWRLFTTGRNWGLLRTFLLFFLFHHFYFFCERVDAVIWAVPKDQSGNSASRSRILRSWIQRFDFQLSRSEFRVSKKQTYLPALLRLLSKISSINSVPVICFVSACVRFSEWTWQAGSFIRQDFGHPWRFLTTQPG